MFADVVNVLIATAITDDETMPMTSIVTSSSTSVNPAWPSRRDVVALRALAAGQAIGDHVVLVGFRLLVGGGARRARRVAHEAVGAGRRDDPAIETVPAEVRDACRRRPPEGDRLVRPRCR